jgi:hypothetical protein
MDEMRRTSAGLRIAIILLVLPGATRVLAHHSFTAEFDDKKTVTLKGVADQVEFTNPHGWLYMNVKDKDGKVENWAIETGAPIQLIRAAATRSRLPVGTEIMVDGWLARDGSRTVNGRTNQVCQTAGKSWQGTSNAGAQ